ncbi:unnamed protein product [Psylliodes chrysocephalus]|uniref:Uncharacterized protein n=1 Tax=Psylliodes chrysocephalus TaxID=3402493 RepID=A0A9P0GG37_9CUCU|nr:unnamed protein product [Psylliodes chrysocephala]
MPTNAYFSHTENLLLAMMFDPGDFVRELAIRRILKARQQTPKINFEAKDYINLTDWQKCTITEPPLVIKLSDNCFQQLITEKQLSLTYFDVIRKPWKDESKL